MEQLESFIKHWPRMVFCMLAGALIGYAAWMFLPQEYAATAGLGIGINYHRIGKLSDIEQDQILGITEDILHSDELMHSVFEASSAADYESFYGRTQISRTDRNWHLTVTGEDPEEIGKLALFWRDSAYDRLSSALEHAVRADALSDQLEGLTRCIQDSSAFSAGNCLTDPEEITAGINTLLAQLREEKEASKGLSSAVILGSKDPEALKIRSATRSAAADTVLGALCGLAAAFAIVWFPGYRKQE